MEIIIDPQAVEYIEKNTNNRTITIDLKMMGSG